MDCEKGIGFVVKGLVGGVFPHGATSFSQGIKSCSLLKHKTMRGGVLTLAGGTLLVGVVLGGGTVYFCLKHNSKNKNTTPTFQKEMSPLEEECNEVTFQSTVPDIQKA